MIDPMKLRDLVNLTVSVVKLPGQDFGCGETNAFIRTQQNSQHTQPPAHLG